MGHVTRTKALTPEQMALWHAVRTFSEDTLARVAHDVLEATGLSAADYGVLSTLNDYGNGRLRQRELAIALNWDKSRISHQLARMQERKLLSRTKTAEHGSRVELTALGRAAFAEARPAHADAVRRHLIDRLTSEQAAAIRSIAGFNQQPEPTSAGIRSSTRWSR
jgi:DNA-binding MarR family transcriptional regulator